MEQIVQVGDSLSYENFLPEHLRELYRDSLSDVQLTSLRRQLALYEIRIKTLLKALDQKVLTAQVIENRVLEQFPTLDQETAEGLSKFFESLLPSNTIDQATFGRLAGLVDKYESAMASRNIRNADEALRQMFDIIKGGKRVGDIWDEIQKAIEMQHKLGQSEEKRMQQMSQSLTLDKVVTLLGYTIQAIKESVMLYVKDKETQQHILEYAERTYAAQLGSKLNP